MTSPRRDSIESSGRVMLSRSGGGRSPCTRSSPARSGGSAFMISLAENDPEAQANAAGCATALAQLGWIEGPQHRTDYRWGVGDPAPRPRRRAGALALSPMSSCRPPRKCWPR